MSAEANKASVLRFLEELANQGKVAVWDEFAHPNVLVHGVYDVRGSAEAKSFFTQLLRASRFAVLPKGNWRKCGGSVTAARKCGSWVCCPH